MDAGCGVIDGGLNLMYLRIKPVAFTLTQGHRLLARNQAFVGTLGLSQAKRPHAIKLTIMKIPKTIKAAFNIVLQK